jgi:hypothetical protein
MRERPAAMVELSLNAKDWRSSMMFIDRVIFCDLQRCESKSTIVFPNTLSKISAYGIITFKKVSQWFRWSTQSR